MSGLARSSDYQHFLKRNGRSFAYIFREEGFFSYPNLPGHCHHKNPDSLIVPCPVRTGRSVQPYDSFHQYNRTIVWTSRDKQNQKSCLKKRLWFIGLSVFHSDTIGHENPTIFAVVIGTLNPEFENKNASLQNSANLAGRVGQVMNAGSKSPPLLIQGTFGFFFSDRKNFLQQGTG